MMKRFYRRSVIALAPIFLVAGLWYVWPEDLVKPQFTISKATTFFTEPVDSEGYIDYLDALNKNMQQGVTVDNNAMVLLMQAIGPKPEKGSLPPDYYHRLGITVPAAEGSYLISINDLAVEKDWPELSNIDLINDWYTNATQRKWNKAQFPRVAEWIERNTAPLVLVEKASRRTEYYSPMVYAVSAKSHQKTLMGSLLPCIQRCREIANVLMARAMLRIDEKRFQDAWNDIITTMRLGRVLAKGKTLIEFLVGLALQNLAAEACIVMLESPGLDVAFLNQCIADIEALPPHPVMAEKISVGDRAMVLDMFLLLNRYGPGGLEAWGGNEITKSSNKVINSWRNADWDPALKKLNAWYDRLAAMTSEKDRAKRQQMFKDFRKEMVERKLNMHQGSKGLSQVFMSTTSMVDRNADLIATLLTPAVDKVMLTFEKTEQRGRMLRIAFALAKYQHDNKNYPETLTALAPKYLANIPQDLFSGHPVIYRKTEKGYVLYSVGSNGQDDEGRNENSDPRGDDITVQIPVPPLPKKEE